MRVRALVLTAALLWSASVFSETIPMGSFETGNDLFGVCSDDHHFQSSLLQGIRGGHGGCDYRGERTESKWFADTLCLYSGGRTRRIGAS
jgi:hypothetical protein